MKQLTNLQTQARPFYKSALPMEVAFALVDGQLTTLEGSVPYHAGDAIMTGVAGEHWPISRTNFDASYDALAPTLQGESGFYVKKYIVVMAAQLTATTDITLPSSTAILKGNQGDWLVMTPNGDQWIVAADIFQRTYLPVDAA